MYKVAKRCDVNCISYYYMTNSKLLNHCNNLCDVMLKAQFRSTLLHNAILPN